MGGHALLPSLAVSRYCLRLAAHLGIDGVVRELCALRGLLFSEITKAPSWALELARSDTASAGLWGFVSPKKCVATRQVVGWLKRPWS